MTKIVTTCLLGAGLMAAATTLPQSQAHEGHDGHDHGTTQRSEPQVPSNRVIQTPPPFETLDNAPSAGRSHGSSTRNQLQQPEGNWSEPADRRPELSRPRAEGGGVRPFLPTAPETFRRGSENGYYPESRRSRSRDDLSHQPWASPNEGFACPLGRQGAYFGEYPGFRRLPNASPRDGWCPHAVQTPRSSHDMPPHRAGGIRCIPQKPPE